MKVKMEARRGRRKVDPILIVGTLLAVASGVFSM
jgi:hypothetical protein